MMVQRRKPKARNAGTRKTGLDAVVDAGKKFEKMKDGQDGGMVAAAAAGAGAAGGAGDVGTDKSGDPEKLPPAASASAGDAAPVYKCHKQVRALKLTDIVRNNDTGQVILTPEDKRYEPFEAPPGWYERFHGENDTGYFVRYQDGFASWSPTKAFEDGYTLEEGDELNFKSPLNIAELARGVAGAARFFADGAVGKAGLFDREEAAIMADFVRANPDAPVPAMFIHLGLQKRYPRTEPNRADEFVLSLFHAACKAAFKFEADQALEEQYARDAEAAAKTAGGWPGEKAFKPQDPAFAPTGFSPR